MVEFEPHHLIRCWRMGSLLIFIPYIMLLVVVVVKGIGSVKAASALATDPTSHIYGLYTACALTFLCVLFTAAGKSCSGGSESVACKTPESDSRDCDLWWSTGRVVIVRFKGWRRPLKGGGTGTDLCCMDRHWHLMLHVFVSPCFPLPHF